MNFVSFQINEDVTQSNIDTATNTLPVRSESSHKASTLAWTPNTETQGNGFDKAFNNTVYTHTPEQYQCDGNVTVHSTGPACFDEPRIPDVCAERRTKAYIGKTLPRWAIER